MFQGTDLDHGIIERPMMRYFLSLAFLFLCSEAFGQIRKIYADSSGQIREIDLTEEERNFYFNTVVRYYRGYRHANYHFVDDKRTPYSTVTSFIRDTLTRLVHKESLRFKHALHPVYQSKDTLTRLDKKWPGWRTRNPLCILAEHLCDCQYSPTYTVTNVAYKMAATGDDKREDYVLTNFFKVTKKDRFIRVKSNKATDTIYEDVSHRFFPFDSVFTACCIPPTGVCYLTGGNVYSDTVNFLHLGRYVGKYIERPEPDYKTCIEVAYMVKMGALGFGPAWPYLNPMWPDSTGNRWLRLSKPDVPNSTLYGEGYMYFVSFSKANSPSHITYHEYFPYGDPKVTLTYIDRPKDISEVMAYTFYRKISSKEVSFIAQRWKGYKDEITYFEDNFDSKWNPTNGQLQYRIEGIRARFSKYGPIKVIDGAWGEK